MADDLSVALLMTLERLSPLERAAFLLHDMFEMEFGDIAKVLDRSESACRQLAARGRTHVREARPRFRVPEDEATRLSDAFHRALVTGDAAQFAELLAADAILYADGGGKRAAALNPIHGRDRIVRFFEGLAQAGNLPPPEAVHRVRLHGLPGLVVIDRGGAIDTIATLDIRDGRVVAIYAVRNPVENKDRVDHSPVGVSGKSRTDNKTEPGNEVIGHIVTPGASTASDSTSIAASTAGIPLHDPN